MGSTDVETITYGWDDFDKLISVSSALNGVPTTDAKQENSYSANGFRRKKKAKSGAVTTEYSTGLATAVAKTGTDAISYIQGHHILGYELGGDFFWYLTNHLGSVTDIVRGTDGAVLQSDTSLGTLKTTWQTIHQVTTELFKAWPRIQGLSSVQTCVGTFGVLEVYEMEVNSGFKREETVSLTQEEIWCRTPIIQRPACPVT